MPDFKDQVIIISGAASGIGQATAIKLASFGATLALSDVNETALVETSKECNGDRHTTFRCDVSDVESCNRHVEEVVKLHGRLDHVFNCAGVNPTAYDLADVTDDYYDKILNTNLRGTFAITRAAIPHLRLGSSIVNVTSILGTKGAKRMAVYSASKWGVIGFTKSLALELGPQGIRVNAVAPGFIDTPTNSDVVEGPEAMKSAAEKVAMGRMGTSEEVADVVSLELAVAYFRIWYGRCRTSQLTNLLSCLGGLSDEPGSTIRKWKRGRSEWGVMMVWYIHALALYALSSRSSDIAFQSLLQLEIQDCINTHLGSIDI